MAYYSKKNAKWKLETITTIPTSEFCSRDRQIADVNSITQSANLIVANTITSDSQIDSGGNTKYNLPSLAPIQGQDMEVRLIAKCDEASHQRDLDITAIYGQREQDRKVRREIANSNERRRMQSINTGFKSLKTILPHTDGDKLSKAAILQQTAEYIFQLESDKLKLLDQNEKLRRVLSECKCNIKHQALLCDAPEKDEGIGSPREEDLEDIRRDAIEVRQQLDKERRMRMLLEDKIRELETQIYPGKLREIAHRHSVPEPHQPLAKPQAEETASQVVPVPENNVSEPVAVLSPQVLPVAHQTVVYQDVPTSTRIPPQAPTAYGVPQATQPKLPQIIQPRIPQLVQPTLPHLIQPSVNPQTFPETVPPAGLCVTISQEPEIKSPPIQVKSTTTLPRSRQPLKKRAIEIADVDNYSPISKVPKISAVSHAPISNTVTKSIVMPTTANIPTHTTLISVPTKPGACADNQIVQENSASLSHPANISRLQEKLQHPTAVLTSSQQISVAEQHGNPVLLSTSHSNARTYMTLHPPAFPASKQTWQEPPNVTQNFQVAATSANVAAGSQYILHPSMHIVHSTAEEITLNQLNSVPSLSMTLTQLNALPTMTRLNQNPASGNPALPVNRVQTQFLPVVAMDTVLNRRGERRISTATDSTISDEECKSESMENPTRSDQLHSQKVAAAVGRSKSDPGLPTKNDLSAKVSLGLKSSASTPTTLSVLSSGPGSPPILRHIDAAATRRNLETIVQAIDHLEQQERRNSQDQQSHDVENSSPA